MYLRTLNFSLVLAPVLLADCAHFFVFIPQIVEQKGDCSRSRGTSTTITIIIITITITIIIIIILVGGGSKIKGSWRFLC